MHWGQFEVKSLSQVRSNMHSLPKFSIFLSTLPQPYSGHYYMAQLLRSNDQKEWKTARDEKKTNKKGARVERDRSTVKVLC